MLRRTPLSRSQKPLKRTGWIKSNPDASKGAGLAQRVAEITGHAIKHLKADPSVFRSQRHRVTIAGLNCVRCGLVGRSQAAHLNLLALGKGRGLKVSDAFLIPLCADGFGYRGCHWMLDQSGIFDRATAETLQLSWLQETRDKLMGMGKWPDEAQADVDKMLNAYLTRRQA